LVKSRILRYISEYNVSSIKKLRSRNSRFEPNHSSKKIMSLFVSHNLPEMVTNILLSERINSKFMSMMLKRKLP